MKLIAGIAGIGALSGLLVHGQQAPAFRSSVDLVPVFATVLTKDGAFVRGLTKDDFTVLDDGKPQEITSFSAEAQTISVTVILDTSSSMAGQQSRVFSAARVFLDQLRPDDRAMLGTLVYQGPPFTADKSRLRTALDLAPPDPGSPVFAALDRALTTLAPETNRRVIVIYTDGKNAEIPVRNQGRAAAGKPATADAVAARVEREGVMVYAIGFEGVKLTTVMKTIAQRSGGRATELKPADDLGKTLAGVADELHQQYLLGFTPAAFDGRVHAIDVRVKSPDQIVRARQTYVARSGGHAGPRTQDAGRR
jgi:Ca-activated chloride channel family protein